MSIKSHKPRQSGRSWTKLAAKISAWIAVVAGIVGLAVKVNQIIQEHDKVPLQQYYATLSQDCLNKFIDDGFIDSPDGKKVSAQYVSSIGFGDTVRTSIKAIAVGKPRTVDEATFLILKNISASEAKEIVFSGPEATGSATHILPGTTIAICLRYASTTGEKQHLDLSTYKFIPERGGSKTADIDPYNQSVAMLAGASKSCTVLGYPPDEKKE